MNTVFVGFVALVLTVTIDWARAQCKHFIAKELCVVVLVDMHTHHGILLFVNIMIKQHFQIYI